MNAGDGLSSRLAMRAGANQAAARSAISDSFFPSQSLTPTGTPGGSTGDHEAASSRDLRAVVERRFKRMNEAHDRIRTEMLAAHPPLVE